MNQKKLKKSEKLATIEAPPQTSRNCIRRKKIATIEYHATNRVPTLFLMKPRLKSSTCQDVKSGFPQASFIDYIWIYIYMRLYEYIWLYHIPWSNMICIYNVSLSIVLVYPEKSGFPPNQAIFLQTWGRPCWRCRAWFLPIVLHPECASLSQGDLIPEKWGELLIYFKYPMFLII